MIVYWHSLQFLQPNVGSSTSCKYIKKLSKIVETKDVEHIPLEDFNYIGIGYKSILHNYILLFKKDFFPISLENIEEITATEIRIPYYRKNAETIRN